MRFLSIIAVAVIGVAALTACNSTDSLTAANSQGSRTSPVPPPADGIRRITVAELQNLVSRNGAFVVDVRNQDSFDAAHIRGAKLMPVGEIEKHTSELPKDKLIVTYCS